MIILALDASTTAVGWSLFDDATYLESGVFVPKSGDWVKRVRYIDLWLHGGSIDFDAIGYEIASGDHGNMEVNRKLGAVEFVVRQFCQLQDIEFIEVNVQQVKATGCHKAALSVADAIIAEAHPHRAHFANRALVGDEADAIGVGLACWKKITEQRLQEMAQ
jgi:hypothetical protein